MRFLCINFIPMIDKLVVGFVWLLIFSLAIAFSFIFLPVLFSSNIIIFFIISIFLGSALLLLIISYAKATCSNPGNPDENLTLQYQKEGSLEKLIEDSQNRQKRIKELRKNRNQKQLLQEQEIKNLKQIGYCSKCNNIKPLRVHHCKICKKCILRMDHHCPWLGTCVGLYNHKYFILFLFYATLGLLIITLSISIDYFSGELILKKVSQTSRYLLYAVCICSFLLLLSIGFLLLTQIIASLENLTTLDTFINGIERNNPWDTNSIYDNLSQIFGRGGYWFLPTKPNLALHPENNFDNYFIFQ